MFKDEKPMPDFYLMWEDEEIAYVHIGETEVHIDRYDLHPVKQIFYRDSISRYQFGEIIRHRCFDENRPDKKELVTLLGLKEYNPFEICMRTHGKMVQDKTWFRFKGEKLRYKDLKGMKYAP